MVIPVELDLEELREIAAERIEHPSATRIADEYRYESRPEVMLALLERLAIAEDRVKSLEGGLREAVLFMKDATRVSIKSRGVQLEYEFFEKPR